MARDLDTYASFAWWLSRALKRIINKILVLRMMCPTYWFFQKLALIQAPTSRTFDVSSRPLGSFLCVDLDLMVPGRSRVEHPGMDPASRLLRFGCSWDVGSRNEKSLARTSPCGCFVELRKYSPSSPNSRKASSEKHSSMFSIIVMIVEDSLWAR